MSRCHPFLHMLHCFFIIVGISECNQRNRIDVCQFESLRLCTQIRLLGDGGIYILYKIDINRTWYGRSSNVTIYKNGMIAVVRWRNCTRYTVTSARPESVTRRSEIHVFLNSLANGLHFYTPTRHCQGMNFRFAHH